MSSYNTEKSISVNLAESIQTLDDLSQIILEMSTASAASGATEADTAASGTIMDSVLDDEIAKIGRSFRHGDHVATLEDVAMFYSAWIQQPIVPNLIKDSDDVQKDIRALGLNPKVANAYEKILDLHQREHANAQSDKQSGFLEMGREHALDFADEETSQTCSEQPLTPEQSKALRKLLGKKLAKRQLELPWTY